MALDPLDQEPLRLFVGLTASGKSALAPELAAALGAEIASMDSMLVYRGMDIGTAKPDTALRARVPHHLIDCVEPSESYSVSRYVEDVRGALADLRSRARSALFVGGTALYLKALTHGLFQVPDVDPALRAQLDERWRGEGAAALHAELALKDPSSAQRLHPNDKKRVLRALEVLAQSGRRLSDWQQEWRDGAARSAGRARRIVALEIDAQELERRIPARTRALLDGGWVEEVRRVRERCGFGATAAQALGYSQVLELADGLRTRESCEAEINLRTRQFARRQRTWFRQFPEICWVPADASDAAARVLSHLRA
jgi:tRNA dimethylallyltransferase